MGDIVAQYGLLGIVGLVVLGTVVWALVHWAAEPGSEVKLLFGLASYKKRSTPMPQTPPPSTASSLVFKPIDVIHEYTDTLWRVVEPLERWIDADLTGWGRDSLDTLLAGPYHATCKMDLSYYDPSGEYGNYRVHRKCPSCDKPILSKAAGVDDRFKLKQIVLQLIQQAHLLRLEIGPGLVVPAEEPDMPA